MDPPHASTWALSRVRCAQTGYLCKIRLLLPSWLQPIILLPGRSLSPKGLQSLESRGNSASPPTRFADSLMFRSFLGYKLDRRTPDNSTLRKTRQKIPVAAFTAVFDYVLDVCQRRDLLRGRALGTDGTLVDANPSMDSLRHKELGCSCEECTPHAGGMSLHRICCCVERALADRESCLPDQAGPSVNDVLKPPLVAYSGAIVRMDVTDNLHPCVGRACGKGK